MGTRLLFYLLLYPLSWLPLPLLYLFSYPFYWVIAKGVKYRKAVIDQNLRNAFPGRGERELSGIRDRYYKHLSEIAAEMIKMLSLRKKTLRKRYRCLNPEILHPYHQAGRSVILMSSHHNNWEWMVLGLDLFVEHRGVGVGAPNSNKVFEKIINRFRTRYGTTVVFADHVREEFALHARNGIPTAYMMLSDQSPSNPVKSFKALFLEQPTAVLYGAEHFALKYNMPVFYYEVRKVKKGCYEILFRLITDHPETTLPGEITTRYLRLLEETIRRQPAYWLWSHKRWKHAVQPGDMQDVKY